MFGLEFMFIHALWALPLAALPLVLHLLFRRKSPVVMFSTLRFVRASLQRTAARKRLYKWLLLACRILLLALLIWAVSQPVRSLADRWTKAGEGVIAAIVVDTSYSMLLRQDGVPLLSLAEQSVQELLREELAGAQVAIFTSDPSDAPEQLRSASEIRAQWSSLSAQPARQPLVARIASANAFLDRQEGSRKWLIVITDLQSREFPYVMPSSPADRRVLLNLRPRDPRSAGIVAMRLTPDPPTAGLSGELAVSVVGRGVFNPAVQVELSTSTGQSLHSAAPQIADTGDGAGRSTLRFSFTIPAERYVLARATLPADDLQHDDVRTLLIEVPAKRNVRFIASGSSTPADRFTQLALDPGQGRLPAWPLTLRTGDSAGDDDAVVRVLTTWPDEADARRLEDFARRGGIVVLLIQPGLEHRWGELPESQRSALARILPGTPQVLQLPGSMRGHVERPADPIFSGLLDGETVMDRLVVQRLVPFTSGAPGVYMLLSARGTGRLDQPQGLMYRRSIGSGAVITLATLPESRFTNLATHPLFLPLLVRSTLMVRVNDRAINVELGEPLILQGSEFDAQATLNLRTPSGQIYAIHPSQTDGARRFVFDRAVEPGLYTWFRPDDGEMVALSNVVWPSEESELVYREPAAVLPLRQPMLVASSMDELRALLAEQNEGSPRWSLAVAMVLMLVCLESLLANTSSGLLAPWSWLRGRFTAQ